MCTIHSNQSPNIDSKASRIDSKAIIGETAPIPHPDPDPSLIPAHVPYDGRTPAGAIRFRLPPASDNCLHCQAPIPPPSGRGNRKVFCSGICQRRWRRGMLIDMGWCADCGRHPPSLPSKTCSVCIKRSNDKSKRKRERDRISRPPPPPPPKPDTVISPPRHIDGGLGLSDDEIRRLRISNRHAHLQPPLDDIPDYWERNRPVDDDLDEDDSGDTNRTEYVEVEYPNASLVNTPRMMVQSGLSIKQVGMLMMGKLPKRLGGK